jgi:hypothetical protein
VAVQDAPSDCADDKGGRFIQTALGEWAHAASYASSKERAGELPHRLHGCNSFRNHSALQNKPPISRIGLAVNNVLQIDS